MTPFFQEQTKSQDEAFENSHEALQSVVKISPLAAHTAILIYGKSCMPFMMTPFTHMHTNYISNLLKITKYLPNERVSILTLVIDRLVQLDAHLPIGEDLYDFDDRYSCNNITRTLIKISCLFYFGFFSKTIKLTPIVSRTKKKFKNML